MWTLDWHFNPWFHNAYHMCHNIFLQHPRQSYHNPCAITIPYYPFNMTPRLHCCSSAFTVIHLSGKFSSLLKYVPVYIVLAPSFLPSWPSLAFSSVVYVYYVWLNLSHLCISPSSARMSVYRLHSLHSHSDDGASADGCGLYVAVSAVCTAAVCICAHSHWDDESELISIPLCVHCECKRCPRFLGSLHRAVATIALIKSPVAGRRSFYCVRRREKVVADYLLRSPYWTLSASLNVVRTSYNTYRLVLGTIQFDVFRVFF